MAWYILNDIRRGRVRTWVDDKSDFAIFINNNSKQYGMEQTNGTELRTKLEEGEEENVK